MPTAYRIDPVHRVVLSSANGVLTEADSWTHYEALEADPLFDANYCQLCDLREVSQLEASTPFLRALAEKTIFAPGARRAFVASADHHFGLARMLQVFAEVEGTEIEVFRSVEEAQAWLGIATNPSG